MIVVENRPTQDRFLRPQFVIFRCQKICKKGHIEMAKKIYLETLKSAPERSIFHYFPFVLLYLESVERKGKNYKNLNILRTKRAF